MHKQKCLLLLFFLVSLVNCSKKEEESKNTVLDLATDVIDAEYSRVKNWLVYVPSGQPIIYIYDTDKSRMSSININYIPTCISLAANGETAVVGHDAHLTYVDLVNKRVIGTYSVSCYVNDIVLADNKWAYAFPRVTSSIYFKCVNLNLSSDNEVSNSGAEIYGGTKAKLHPSGKYIYGTDNGLDPSDIEKYDIQEGKANFLYDSPYHGEYLIDGNLWFSESGDRVFTRGMTVLTISEIPSRDLIYNGTIELEGTTPASCARIQWLEHSEDLNKLFILSTTDNCFDPDVNKPYVYVHNATNLAFEKKYELEKYKVKNNDGQVFYYDPEPFFIFYNTNNKRIFVVTKASNPNGGDQWAIHGIPVE